MSADNWTICPRCKSKATNDQDEKRLAAKKAYGLVSPDEYLTMLRASERALPLEETLREDFSIGVTGTGDFYIDYSCRCSVCNFSHKHKESKHLLPAKP